MQIDVKAKNEDGDVVFEGTLNRREIGFLLQYAVNDLMMAGVQFHLEQPDEGESRMEFPPHEGKSH